MLLVGLVLVAVVVVVKTPADVDGVGFRRLFESAVPEGPCEQVGRVLRPGVGRVDLVGFEFLDEFPAEV